MKIRISEQEFEKALIKQMSHLDHHFQQEIDEQTELMVSIPSEDLEKMVKTIRSVRQQLGSDKNYLVCVREITEKERNALVAAGATRVVVPSSWSTKAIVDRIGGEIALLSEHSSMIHTLIGQSQKMYSVFEEITMFARVKKDLMILGESGTGKELVARSIHDLGIQQSSPFIAINCAEMEANNLISRLFGHKTGAFTGADTERKGAFFEAEEGTVFLDEVAELKPEVQPMLLRALQERKATPLGENNDKEFYCRVLVATNKTLDQYIGNDQRGNHLFSQFEGFIINLPPLRERMEDIPLLAHHFMANFNQKQDRQIKMTDAAIDLLITYPWPRNVRQLSQFIESAATFTGQDSDPLNIIRLKKLIGASQIQPANDSFSESDTWATVESRTWLAYAEFVKNLEGGDTKKAAERAGVSRSAFYDRTTRALSHIR